MSKRRRLTAGLTAIEVLVASTISTLAIVGAMSVYINGMGSWARGARMISAETESTTAVSFMADQLREATGIIVPGSGMSVTYQVPARDANGKFQFDVSGNPVWDGRTRSFYVTGGDLWTNDGANPPYILARNVVLTDPLSSPVDKPYKPFVAGAGQNIRDIDVMIVLRQKGGGRDRLFGRKRETVYLRNIPDSVR